jgi:hypothetical protein
MENAENRQPPNPPIAQPRQGWWVRLIGYIKRKSHERKAKKKEETPADRATRRTATATVWIAVFTVVLGFVSLFTLYEVMEGGTDTHDLAKSADTQAKLMSRQLEQMMMQSYGWGVANRMKRPLFKQRVRLRNELHNYQNDFRAVAELENIGSTPSIDLVESTQIWIADSEKPTSTTWKDCPKVGVLMKSELVSCETASLNATPDEIQAYQRKTSRLYIRVDTLYWDDFEWDFRHQQSMCLFHIFGEPLNHFNYCASGNGIWHTNYQKTERETERDPHPPRPPGIPEPKDSPN